MVKKSAIQRKARASQTMPGEIGPVLSEEALEATAETPRGRFLRLAPARTTSALKRIKLLGNLAGSSYEYTKTEAAQIVEALFDATHDLKRRFEKKTKTKGFEFKEKAP